VDVAQSTGAGRGRAAVVVNPTKVTQLGDFKKTVNAAFEQRGWQAPLWYETTAADAGYGQTREAVQRGVSAVVACGGDGTVRQCVNALCGSNVPLAILPAGTGNLLAYALGLPRDIQRVIDLVTSGQRRCIDVGQADGTPFMVMAGMGFDAQMVGDASERLKAYVGVVAYLWTALKRLLESPMLVHITLDGNQPIRRFARCVLVGKVGRLPGGIKLMDVEADDGRLAIAVVSPSSLRHWLKIAWAIVTRRSRVPRVETYRAERVLIEATHAQRRQIDGDEISRDTSLSARVVPHAVHICVPANVDSRRSPTSALPLSWRALSQRSRTE
jgi:YegS/Rv2252/BmrU family lipid kinase